MLVRVTFSDQKIIGKAKTIIEYLEYLKWLNYNMSEVILAEVCQGDDLDALWLSKA